MNPAEGQRDSLFAYSSHHTAKSSNIMAGNTFALPSEVTLNQLLNTALQKSSQSASTVMRGYTLDQFHFRKKTFQLRLRGSTRTFIRAPAFVSRIATIIKGNIKNIFPGTESPASVS